MAEQNPPTFIQAGTHSAEETRRFISAAFARRPGIISSGDLAVTENGTPNMTLTVAIGACVINGSQATFQGMYYCENRTATTVTVTAAHATLARKDLVVAKVEDAAYSGATNAWSCAVVAGTPAGSPAEPSAPNNSIVLAMVDIPAADTAITNSQITDRRITTSGQGRAVALGGVQVATSAARPTVALQEGAVIYETDTDRLKTYDGSSWQNAASYPSLFARKTVDESVTSSTSHQNDDALVLSVAANAVYTFETFIIYDGATGGDFNARYSIPASASIDWTPRDISLSETSLTASLGTDHQHITAANTSGSGALGSGTDVVIVHKGLLVTGASSGSLQLQWAQDASSGTATKVKAGSWIKAFRES